MPLDHSQSPTPGGRPILLIAEFFPPPQHSGTLRSAAFARDLPRYGYAPIVLTSADRARPHRLGLESCASSDREFAGLPVTAAPWDLRQVENDSVVRRCMRRLPLLNSFELWRRRRRLMNRLTAVGRELIESASCRLIFATSGPPEALMLARLLSQATAIPYVVDLRDPWSYQPALPYRHYFDFLLERRLERKVLRDARAVIVTAEASARLAVNQLRVPAHKVAVIQNGFDQEDFAGVRIRQGRNDKFIILHAGQLNSSSGVNQASLKQNVKSALRLDYLPLKTDYQTRSAEVILAALGQLLDTHAELRGRVEVQLVGCGGAELDDLLRQFPYRECVTRIPRVEPKYAAQMCCDADLLLLLQNKTCLQGSDFCVAVAAKVYTYLRSGRRILVGSQPSEMGTLVRQFDAGREVPAGDARRLAEAIKQEFDLWQAGASPPPGLRDLPGFDRRARAGELADLLDSVIGAARHDAPGAPAAGSRRLVADRC